MKTSSFFASLLVCTMLIFTQCSKDDKPTPAAKDFIPLTEGTSWTYISNAGSASPVTFKLTVTNKDTTVNSKTYKVLTNSISANDYMSNNGSDHYRLASFATLGINNFEDLYLKDDKAVNDTWTSTANFSYSGIPLTATLTYTIKEKGAARTVGTKNFTDVIHIRADISVSNFGAVGGGEFYYANGIGLIESSLLVTPPAILGVPNYTSAQLLTDYEIK